ncbi:hypothetical protein ETD86_47050 [Nonomuraea turkmeniaca]|uniref:Uncharacterized protein n=1 Tax=Nonomuraea turkmeniaca TaxID=103838 RepID=A0A5S4FHV4_9ACTN|nr:hypothetical protein [Nonomuraea turkmeniaca]TMR08606.1 hypothetical protein ETD86_47050 [Nonomuraea turkmeniaca]
MLALSLGVAWLLLGPLSLWLLVKGSTTERVGAIVTLALLEGGTIVMNQVAQDAIPEHSVVSHDVSPTPACDARTPAPRSARVGRALVLAWPAVRRECGTAEVTVRSKGRRLLVWVRTVEGPGDRRTVLPVRVKGDMARVTVPLPDKSGRIAVDGRSGRRIPAPTT